jgi:hypothetical protein
MNNQDLLNDVRFLRDMVARTERPQLNYYWPVTLGWGIVITITYLICGVLAMAGKWAILPWVWPLSIFCVAFPLQWYLVGKVRRKVQELGVRPRISKDLMCLWLSITLIGMLWSAGLAIAGIAASHWYLFPLVWCSLYFIGYMMNGVLLSNEWFWAAAVMLASMIAAYVAGPNFYWLPGAWIGGTFLLAGWFGRRNVRRQMAEE